MSDVDTLLQQLKKDMLAEGHAFSDLIQGRLSECHDAARHVVQALPDVPSTEGLTAFRTQLAAAFLPAYAAFVASTVSPDELAAAFRSWIEAQDTAGARLPEYVEEAEPERLYQASSADTALTSARKGFVRLTRRLRSETGSPVRQVPMRLLGAALAREWLPIQFGKVIDDDRRRLARHVSRVERAVSDLVYATLRAENRWRLAQDSSAVHGRDAAAMPIDATLDTASSEILEQALHRLKEAHDRLKDRLSDAATELTSAATDVDQRMERAWIFLEGEVEKAGSFMGQVPRVEEAVVSKRLGRIDGESTAWAAWKDRLSERATFLAALLSLRSDLDGMIDRMQRDVARELIEPLGHRAAAVTGVLLETERNVTLHAKGTGQEGFEERTASLKALGDKAIEHVREHLVAPIQEMSLLTRVQEENQAFLDSLARLIETLPDPFQLHPLVSESDESIDPGVDSRVVSLPEVVRNGVAEIDTGKLEGRTAEAREDLKESLEELVNLPSIVRFSFDSATATRDVSPAQPGSADTSDADQLLTMMEESLRRTRDAITTIGEKIEGAASLLIHAYRAETLHAWTRIQERLQMEHQVGAYVMDVRSRLDAEAREAGQRLSRLSRQLRLLSERLLLRGRREAQALIERGKEVVGTPSPTRASFHDTALGLAELEKVLEKVPAVYRKLFSFQPLTDPDLLIGRGPSMTFVRNQLHQFDLGMPQAALLVGGPSSGRTSLLNVLQTTDFSNRPVRTLQLHNRPSDTGSLLSMVAASLELPVPRTDHVPKAASAWLEALDAADAPICIVEHLEVLLLRGIGGYDLLVDMLQLMSLTDSRIIWVGTISTFAWQLLKVADADAAALVSVHAMTDLTRTDLEELIMERHRKSGIPLEFAEPEEPNPLLKRKLKRVSSRDMRQQLLREAFFDRLYSQFGQNIQMALLQWIRSVRMTDDTGSMTLVQTPALNLSFFNGFNMDQVFALKAILEHGALSPSEYARVDHIPEDRALTVFETLGNALVIETADRSESGTLYRHTAVEASRAYRIRPLFSHAVIRLLRERNVVH